MLKKALRPGGAGSRKLLPVAGGVVVVLLALTLAAAMEKRRLSEEFLAQATGLHRQLSQRVDQHDAHLTALSAVATAEGESGPAIFRQVAATIVHFYPRITAVDLVALTHHDQTLSTRTTLGEDLVRIIRSAASASDGQLVLRPVPGVPGRYLVIKRSPNTDQARFGIALEIDAAGLFDSEAAYWSQASVSLSLALPDGTLLVGDAQARPAQFEKELGSKSQPLRLRASSYPELADLLPPGRIAAVSILAALGWLAFVLALGQFARARKAEREAVLSAREARLAHASRVNVLGEMASGMAHELTQPLTAILSQAQAGGHLARRGDADAVVPVFHQIAEQAKRASAILASLRNWTKPTPPTDRLAGVGQAIEVVELLLTSEAKRRGVRLVFKRGTGAYRVKADQVELEQVLFNLVNNAIEAAAGGADAWVEVVAEQLAGKVEITIADSGPGLPGAVRDRLFEPFVTGKPGGTGLGLALCQRLAERMGGEVALAGEGPTVFRVTLPIQPGHTAEEAG